MKRPSTLEDEYAEILAKEIQSEIDWEIITTLLIESSGYVKVKLDKYYEPQDMVEIQSWLDKNCSGQVEHKGIYYIFEKAEDAEWFILRWA